MKSHSHVVERLRANISETFSAGILEETLHVVPAPSSNVGQGSLAVGIPDILPGNPQKTSTPGIRRERGHGQKATDARRESRIWGQFKDVARDSCVPEKLIPACAGTAKYRRAGAGAGVKPFQSILIALFREEILSPARITTFVTPTPIMRTIFVTR
ncbi:hypothetical protein BDV93DRAFT_511370 [Ceratobasidium sp. AG-I]|nr:hypothetical protein BDV93DRAFT_511370 [Ceratobasidium sp. AG-I]